MQKLLLILMLLFVHLVGCHQSSDVMQDSDSHEYTAIGSDELDSETQSDEAQESYDTDTTTVERNTDNIFPLPEMIGTPWGFTSSEIAENVGLEEVLADDLFSPIDPEIIYQLDFGDGTTLNIKQSNINIDGTLLYLEEFEAEFVLDDGLDNGGRFLIEAVPYNGNRPDAILVRYNPDLSTMNVERGRIYFVIE